MLWCRPTSASEACALSIAHSSAAMARRVVICALLLRPRTGHATNRWVTWFPDKQRIRERTLTCTTAACFDTYYVFGHRYETTRLAATPRYTFKVRAYAFFDASRGGRRGMPPSRQDLKKGACSSKRSWRTRSAGCGPIRSVLTGARATWSRSRALTSFGSTRMRGALLKRERFSGGDRPELIARYYLGSYRDVRGGIWLPYTIHRVLEATSLDTLYEVQKYEVNSVPDELFSFTPVPGTLIVDRDTDTFRQVPGGTDYLQELCARANSISGGAARGTTSVGALALRLLTIAACGAVLAFMGGARY